MNQITNKVNNNKHMASQNKKNKAKNSYIFNGGEKNTISKWKCKRQAYYTKKDRLEQKKSIADEVDE